MSSVIFSQANIVSIGLIVVLVTVFPKKIYPPLFLFIYLFLSRSETTGISLLFSLPINFIRLLYVFLTASAIISFFRLWKFRNTSSTNFRLFLMALLAAILAFWIYLSRLFGDSENFLNFLEVYYFAGPYAFIITLAYYRERRARALFIFFILIQIVLAMSIVLFPDGPWHIFNASEHLKKIYDIPFSMREGLDIYGSRTGAQFSNTITMGFYGGCALIIGLYLFVTSKKLRNKIMPITFLVMGFWLQLISVTRTIFIAIAFSLFLIITRARGTIKMLFLVIIILVILPSLLIWISSLDVSPQLEPTIHRFKQLTNYFDDSSSRIMIEKEPRLKVVRKSAKYIFDNPLFGYKGDVLEIIKTMKGLPHIASVYFMLMYGIPAGIILSILLFLGIVSDLIKEQPQFNNRISFARENYFFNRNRRNLCSMFGWLVFLVTMTNWLTPASITWIVLAIAAIPWAESVAGI